MSNPPDNDQGGNSSTADNIYYGPTLGWMKRYVTAVTLGDLTVSGTLFSGLIAGGTNPNSTLKLLSTTGAGGVGNTDAVTIGVGNNGSFTAFNAVHAPSNAVVPVETLFTFIGGTDADIPGLALSKLNVIGGGHNDTGGGTILCYNTDAVHDSVEYIEITPNIFLQWAACFAATGDAALNKKEWNVGICGPAGADNPGGVATGALMIFDHDWFVHRGLFLPTGDILLGGDCGVAPVIKITAGAGTYNVSTGIRGLEVDGAGSFNGFVDGYGFTATPVAVASLPAASTLAGTRAFVTDSSVTTFGSIVAGGGTTHAPVYSDGTNWRIG